MKVCSTCKVNKKLAEFPKNSKGTKGRGHICNSCAAKVSAKYRDGNYLRVYANKYKTTEDHIAELIKVLNCQICGVKAPYHRRLAIDHCHTTGKIRGVLCDFCNQGLGRFRDSKHLLRLALNYMEQFDD